MDDSSSSSGQTGAATLALLESRLRRIEQVLYGPPAAAAALPPAVPTVETLASLERRFSSLVSGVRVYAELLKIYQSHPSLFQAPPPDVPPTQLDADAVLATVLSYSSAFPATASGLNAALVDLPVPDAALSAQLVALVPRMAELAAAQRALDGEIATLRRRSERLIRQYYERQALGSAKLVANVETRLERAEGRVRRLEKAAANEELEGV